jgi:hypothetical protein
MSMASVPSVAVLWEAYTSTSSRSSWLGVRDLGPQEDALGLRPAPGLLRPRDRVPAGAGQHPASSFLGYFYACPAADG